MRNFLIPAQFYAMEDTEGFQVVCISGKRQNLFPFKLSHPEFCFVIAASDSTAMTEDSAL